MNILDYMTWRGDLSFKASPFNEIDNLIICQMAYTIFDSYFEKKDSYKITELSELFFKDHSDEEIKKSKSFVGQAPFILRAMANSVRFKNSVIHDFVSTVDEKTTEQFCCFQIDLSDGSTYVAFRGTDDTIVGWHEDFCLSYKTIPAQIAAANYLNTHLKPRKKYRIGGHSKGGNLAVYAAIKAIKKNKCILKVYSNDGPGLNKKCLSEEDVKNYELIKDKIVKIMPEFDVFGILFAKNRNTKIIKSNGFMMLQHDAYTWQVEGTHFVEGELSEESKMIRIAFKDFINKASKEECEQFSTELFKALSETGLETVSDFMNGGIPTLIKVISNLGEMNPTTKKFGASLISALAKGYGQGIGEKTKNIKNSIFDSVANKEKEIMDFINLNVKK